MEHINSILRTLCLAALLCITSVNASAYMVYYDTFSFAQPEQSMGNEKILVIDRNIEIEHFNTPRGEYACIINPGVTVTVTNNFDNESKLYVFGTLWLKDGMQNKANFGIIYKMTEGTIDGNINNGHGKIEDVSPETILTKAKLSGQKPELGKPGWKDFWAKGISESGDFGPVYCYEDEELKNKIPDFEAWKKGDGKLCVLQLGDKEYFHDGKSLDANVCFNDKVVYGLDDPLDVTGQITYSRTFNNTNWQPLYVPFAMSYGEWEGKFDVATINNFHEYTDENGETVKTELEVRMVTSGTLKPNHPYLIKAKKADEINPQEINLSTRKLYKSDENSYSCSSMESKYTFTGTYNEMNGLKTNDYIFMSGGKLCMAENDDVALSPQRWYLKITPLGSQVDADESGGSSDAKAMQFDIKVLDDEPTGIDEITVTRTPLKNSSEAVYNLNGMRVNGNYKGIVIKNGKKIYQR